MVQNKALIFTQIPESIPIAGQHLAIQQSGFDLTSEPPSGGLTGRVLHASFDPYLRHRLVGPEEARDGFEPLPVGSVIPNGIIVCILRSDNERFRTDDVVVGMGPIQEYVSLGPGDANQFFPIQNPHNLDLKLFLGPLGMPGLTAYSALYEIGQPKKGEVIFISAASGAVGQIVGQLALREGLVVIGSAGSNEKLRLLTDVFKFNGAFNYQEGDIQAQLKQLAPDGIDIYYDNVGGEQLEAAISSLKDWGRIVACGYASQYSIPPHKQYGIRNTSMIIGKRLTWKGLSVFDKHMGDAYRARHQEAVSKWIIDGSFKPVMSETNGIDQAAQGLVELFKGNNVGKALLNV
ncbi:hypothetical protein G7Z17_g2141 [Cylindrodendrum hubeiense]|uniref:Dehydrogenase FUB6 n=1 Tax=Cylindrodendrum hubeiense TaxID=595255 RepID=A0A9P5HJC8_9HYPO|nr:hypothetical protein G7Z17_g2141 [Cylindrodendrum hubeiense]